MRISWQQVVLYLVLGILLLLTVLLVLFTVFRKTSEQDILSVSVVPNFTATPTPTPTPTPELARDANGVLIGSRVFETAKMFMGNCDGIQVRREGNMDAETVTAMGLGQKAEAYEVVEGWYRVKIYPGMQEGYVRSDLLSDWEEGKTYVAQEKAEIVKGLKSRLVDVRRMLPDIEYLIIYATPGNFYGETLYERDLPLLQQETVEKLKAAQDRFQQDGYTIKLYDGYRPSSVSGLLYERIQDANYIAKKGYSAHNKGAAVDMTLVDASGTELEMPTPMHTLNNTANRNYTGMTAKARANMDYMTNIMVQCGFTTIRTEWWHFQDKNLSKFPALDYPMSAFTMEESIPIEE